MRDAEELPSRGQNWLAGSAAAFLVFLAGVFVKEQSDIAHVEQSEKDHSDADDKQFLLLQQQIDRRIAAVDSNAHELSARIEKAKDSDVSNATIIVENRAQIAALIHDLATLKAQFDQGRGERIVNDEALSKRIDELALRVTEVQRQIAAIEGPDAPQHRR